MEITKENFLNWLQEQPQDRVFDYHGGTDKDEILCPFAAFLKEKLGAKDFVVTGFDWYFDTDKETRFNLPEWFFEATNKQIRNGVQFTTKEFLTCF